MKYIKKIRDNIIKWFWEDEESFFTIAMIILIITLTLIFWLLYGDKEFIIIDKI